MLLDADAGRSVVHGFDADSEVAQVREPIGLTGQFAAVDDILSDRENLVLVPRLRRLQDTRRPLNHLGAGGQLALPDSVVGYLDRLRALGVGESYVEMERDAWIMIAAQVPDEIEEIMRGKHRDLDNPDMVRLYRLISSAPDWDADDRIGARCRTDGGVAGEARLGGVDAY